MILFVNTHISRVDHIESWPHTKGGEERGKGVGVISGIDFKKGN